MAVRIRDLDLKVIGAIVEVRYDDGLRFYDRRGEVLTRVKAVHRNAVTPEPKVSVVSFGLPQMKITLNVTPVKMDLSLQIDTKLANAGSSIAELAKQTAQSYPAVIEALSIASTIRVGARFVILAPSENLEQADRFISRAIRTAPTIQLLDSIGGELVDGQLIVITDDPDSGFRRRIQLASLITKLGDTPFVGLGTADGVGGVGVDIDTFTRPETGHFEKLEYFVNDSYQKAVSIAKKSFQWMQSQQSSQS